MALALPKIATVIRLRLLIWKSVLLLSIVVSMTPSFALAVTVKHQYFKAEGCLKMLRHDPDMQQKRQNWLFCINKFQAVHRRNPRGAWAAAAMYMSSELYREVYKRYDQKADKKKAMDGFARICKSFPKSSYSRKATSAMRYFSQPGPLKFTQKAAVKNVAANSRSLQRLDIPASDVDKQQSSISDVHCLSNPKYTRIIIDTSRNADYQHRLLDKRGTIDKPQQLLVDFSNAKLGLDIRQPISVNGDLLSAIRVVQYKPGQVRIVMDIKSFKTYKIFSLKNPDRTIIDVWGNPCLAEKIMSVGKAVRDPQSSTISKQSALLRVKRIVIDPGHGGKDTGAVGAIKGVYEKDIVLKIAKKLARKIHRELRCDVVLTRSDDRFLSLEERTEIANANSADLFISIHTNAARHPNVHGIETYFLNLAIDGDAIHVAARENATATRKVSDLQSILRELMQNTKTNESSRLAEYMQTSMYSHMHRKYSSIVNKGVKQAPFYVLFGAKMPAILIETSFISNKRECRRLVNPKYQTHLCIGITNGIRKYINATNPTAYVDALYLKKAGG